MLMTSLQQSSGPKTLVLEGKPLTVFEVDEVARAQRSVRLTESEAVLRRMKASQSLVSQAVDEGRTVYGVTTGYGSMADVAVPSDMAAASQANLLAFLSTGAGAPIDSRHVRAAMLLRANMLMRGLSGVRPEVPRRLAAFLEADAVPVVRELGSIGASGDLVPLAVVARAITGLSGSCRVRWHGGEVDGGDVLRELGMKPLKLLPKEALAIVNGTSFSAAVAANCCCAARDLLGLTMSAHAMMIRALCGREEPFHREVHRSKPHPGQIWTADVLRRLLNEGSQTKTPNQREQVQDRYGIRCLPQYFGPIVEGFARVQATVHTEMNGVSDNPLVDGELERFHQSGNFLGQYVGVAMDDLRRFLGLMAKHLDVQIAQLVAPEFNRGLPPSLTGNTDVAYHMGLKGLQITGNSIMPLLVYHGNPLVEHYPTHAEQYNQNVNGLSWGASHLAWRSVELAQQYLAIVLIFAVQAVDLRARALLGHCDGRRLLGSLVEPLYAAVYRAVDAEPGERSPLIGDDSDHSLESHLASLASDIDERGSIVASVRSVLELYDHADLSR
ncbi:MAG: aromatic amino acid ammonia-lyase [Planctomycetota bacterium]